MTDSAKETFQIQHTPSPCWHLNGELFKFLENKGSVDPAESEIVRHDIFAVQFHALTFDIAERSTLRIEFIEVDIRVIPVFVHHVYRYPAFDCAARTEQVTDVALCR